MAMTIEQQVFAQRLRSRCTHSERMFEMALSGAGAIDFCCQLSAGPYFVDFYFPSREGRRPLAIELDGMSHEGRIDYDETRTRFLMAHLGCDVLRLSDGHVARHAWDWAAWVADGARPVWFDVEPFKSGVIRYAEVTP